MKAASHLSFPKPSLLCYLIDSLVQPVAEYGNEIWGHLGVELKIIHCRFCKFALGVPRTTQNWEESGDEATNFACGGLGRTPLLIKRKVLL